MEYKNPFPSVTLFSVLLTAVLFMPTWQVLMAQTSRTWTGSTDTDWNTASN